MSPLIGEPVAYGIGFAVLVLYTFAHAWAESLVTVAHEGGHMILAIVTGRGHDGFILKDDGSAATTLVNTSNGPGDWLVRFVGYATPPVVGLGGAHVLAAGNGWGVLWVGIVLLVGALLEANNALARAVTGLGIVGVGWVAVYGGPRVQAAVAFALVWLLLIGGVAQAVGDNGGGDGPILAQRTLIPSFVWHGLWMVIAVVSLWAGGRILLDL